MLGFLGGIAASLAPAVGSLVTGAATFLSNAAASLGTGTIATTVIEKSTSLLSVVAQIPKIKPETVIKVVKTAGEIIDGVCDILGVQSDNSEELGAKSVQSEVPMDSFKTTVEYINHLNKQKLDEEKYNKLNEEEKLGCNLRGIGIKTKAVEESIESEFKGKFHISEDFLVTLAKTVKTGSNAVGVVLDVVNTLKGLKENGVEDTSVLSNYIEGKSGGDVIKVGTIFKNVLKNIGIGDVEDYVERMKNLARNYYMYID
ncbi:MAG: hypothetical protein LUG66_10645 [Clostridiales bacterium]|nr:hypothetical protein [Clostridiales bacterium]